MLLVIARRRTWVSPGTAKAPGVSGAAMASTLSVSAPEGTTEARRRGNQNCFSPSGREADHVARRVAERAVADAVELVDRLLHDLGAGRADLFELRVHVVHLEDDALQGSLGQQRVQRLVVGRRDGRADAGQADFQVRLVRWADGEPAVVVLDGLV